MQLIYISSIFLLFYSKQIIGEIWPLSLNIIFFFFFFYIKIAYASFYNKNNKSCTALFLLVISCLKIHNNKFSHTLLFWYKYMHRNYCFRHKRHSYAACDAVLAVSLIIFFQFMCRHKGLNPKPLAGLVVAKLTAP